MNEAAIQEIAKQVAQQQLHESWPYVVALLVLSAAVGAVSNYVTSYFRKRGETRALKADLEELLRQSKAITSNTEEVRTSISQSAWASREARTIRRAKLEDLILAVHESQDWLTKRRSFIVHGSGSDPGPSSIRKVVVLANLYFPELLVESKRLLNIQLTYDAYQLETWAQKGQAGDNLQARSQVVEASSIRSHELFSEHLVAVDELAKISRSLMQEILGA